MKVSLLRFLVFVFFVVLFLITILPRLYSFAATTNIDQDRSEQAIDMGNYTVNAPLGEGWKVEVEKDKGAIKFSKQTKSFFGGGLPVTIIHVSRNWVLQEKWNLSEEEIANDYRTGEAANMMVQGGVFGDYILEDVKNDTMTLDEKNIYTMSYKTTGGKWFGKSKVQEATLYLYFPPDFKEKHAFYIFVMSEVHKRDKDKKTDFTQILPVIKSLRLK